MRTSGLAALLVSLALVASGSDIRKPSASWAADNGNGTYSNPLFYDEFSDPDMIRVGSHFSPPAQRWLFGSEPDSGVAVESSAGRFHVVALPATDFWWARNSLPQRAVNLRRGRIGLRTADGQFVSVGQGGKAGDVTLKSGKPGDAETFQWVDLQRGETLLLSLATHRYIVAPKTPGVVAADHPEPAPHPRDGSCLSWKAVPY
jgi:hypothetical protein